MKYDHKKIEVKWQKIWEEQQVFVTDLYDFSKPKYYVLDMFPYPSAQGLHVGHPLSYTATDIVARMKRMQGFNVLHPMGWDSFGLPAEQYAIKTGNHPKNFTIKNIANFKRQIKAIGLSYDWSKEISTSDPDYYKWTQWIFLKMYDHGLAYIDQRPVNYCPELGTVLSNEEVIDGKSEVGGYPVIRKMMKQWILKITAYADRLLEDLDSLDWPISTVTMQRNWIGKSKGTIITFQVENSHHTFDVFTTRADTLFGCTYCCLAPEHELVKKITTEQHQKHVDEYIDSIIHKSDIERTEINREKTGVFTGNYAINPINGKRIPIWIADYVLAGYGSGAVMAVPGHDQRDYEFAKQHNLDIIKVVEGDISQMAYVDDGQHVNSDFINGMNNEQGSKAITDKLINLGKGNYHEQYKLRDWLFSRQRYWGEPIPMVIYEDEGQILPLDTKDLPLVLPELNDYTPSEEGLSPLAKATSWRKVKIKGKKGQRETHTMPQWAGSCWYYLRYLDPKNNKCIADEKLIKHWLPVDLYIGGAEHSVLHLLYARFWHKFLYDIGVVKTEEPFTKLYHQGMILGENGEKMSKSRGNVVNPDEIIENYGADSFRLHMMFMGPLESSFPWSNKGLEGARRFIERVYRLFTNDDFKEKIIDQNNHELDYVYHYTVKKVTDDYQSLQMNTAIAQLMIFINEAYKAKSIYRPYLEGFLKLLNPVCPHITEELWSLQGHKQLLVYEQWPDFQKEKLQRDQIELAVQINGKLRDTIKISIDEDEDAIKEKVLKLDNVNRHIAGAKIRKIIIVKNKIINIVI
jgi:leucyl-tRNA synthetase